MTAAPLYPAVTELHIDNAILKMRDYSKSSADFSAAREDRWMKQKKWGFRIYRTTYESEELWAEFMTKFKAAIKICKPWRENDFHPDLYKGIPDEMLMATLDFHVVEDKAKFDRASRSQLIADFRAWATSEEPKPELNNEELGKVYERTEMVPRSAAFPKQWEKRAGDPEYFDSPRYRFFIQIDQECFESVLAIEDPTQVLGDSWGAKYNGWVNIINSRWPLEPAMMLEDKFRPAPHDPEIQFDNGCWFRATPGYLYPHLFASLTGQASDCEYLRPPRVAADAPGGFAPEFGKMVLDCTTEDDESFGGYTSDRCAGIWWTNDENRYHDDQSSVPSVVTSFPSFSKNQVCGAEGPHENLLSPSP